MQLNFVVPEMAGTFGKLEYAGKGKEVTRRVNGQLKVTGRYYNLYSDVQRADNIEVLVPGTVGEKHFEPETLVKLVNPKIEAKGYSIGEKGFSNYLLMADDIVKA